MSFQPVVPFGGYSGWAFLGRTLATQRSAFHAGPALSRDTAYFSENIGQIESAEQLVSDRRLLRVALGAFGLDDDIDARAFVRKVLEDGTLDPDALGHKLADKRYLEFAKAFGFGDYAVPATQLSDFGDKITAAYRERQFEIAVGEQDGDLRLALALQRDLTEIAAKSTSEDTKWFSIMGTPPLRQVFETALGLPRSFGSLDIDQQLDVLKAKSDSAFGAPTVSQFTDPESRGDLIKLFLLRGQVAQHATVTAPGAVALQLLQAQPTF